MKKKYIVTISSLIGFIFGVGSLFALIYFGPFLTANDVMRANAEESIMQANLLREGKGDNVIKMLDQYLSGSIYMYKNIGFRNDSDLGTAWMIRDYVEKYKISLPTSESDFLANLPERPPSSCSIQKK
jgi:hypothetical protein